MPACHIGIGANLGNAQDNVCTAIARIAQHPACTLEAQSSLFKTAPIDASGDDYINAVIRIQTELSAQALLADLHQIEADFGRERPYHNAPRVIDLDLLLYGNERIDSVTLTVPHPRMTERAFVLIPLLQIDPFISIPGQGAAHAFVPQVADQIIKRI